MCWCSRPTSSSLAGTRGGQRASSCVQKGCRLSSLTSRARSATPRSRFYEWGVLWATPTGPRPRLSESMRRSSEPARQRYECRRRVEFLAVSRRGWVSGGETLTTSLLATAGLANAAPDLGFGSGGFATLELIVAIKPDFILVTDAGESPEDQGQAFLLHPALQRLYPLERRIVIPERLTVCAGPMLADALDRLAEAIGRLSQ